MFILSNLLKHWENLTTKNGKPSLVKQEVELPKPETKANEFAVRIITKLFDKIGYEVKPVEGEFGTTDFVLANDKQKFTFMLKYGGLLKQEEDL